jgi:hypothetical protein
MPWCTIMHLAGSEVHAFVESDYGTHGNAGSHDSGDFVLERTFDRGANGG